MEFIQGGVTAAKGFSASGVHSGIRRSAAKFDLALIYADVSCAAAAVYTTNKVQAAPLKLTQKHLNNGAARAVIANSGNANACAPNDGENALRMCTALAKELGIAADEVIVDSTGVIGQTLPVEVIEAAVPALVSGLKSDESGSDAAASAIMTTDLVQKQAAVKFDLNGVTVTIGAIAKGSGMIHPNMATMFCFITTDCCISKEMLEPALRESVNISFNRVSVDGDTSTNDMTAILASGLAGNTPITTENADYAAFKNALTSVCVKLAKMIARDGEGATKLITCRVTGAKDENTAETLAKSVISSSLVKTAMTGADANFGRVLCAMGYAGAEFDPLAVDIAYESAAGNITVCENGRGLAFDEAKAKEILSADDIKIFCDITNGEGAASAEAYGCNLTNEYVRINGDYRS